MINDSVSPTPHSSASRAQSNAFRSEQYLIRAARPLVATGAEPSVRSHSRGIERNSCAFSSWTIELHDYAREQVNNGITSTPSVFRVCVHASMRIVCGLSLTAATDTLVSAHPFFYFRLLIYCQLLQMYIWLVPPRISLDENWRCLLHHRVTILKPLSWLECNSMLCFCKNELLCFGKLSLKSSLKSQLKAIWQHYYNVHYFELFSRRRHIRMAP